MWVLGILVMAHKNGVFIVKMLTLHCGFKLHTGPNPLCDAWLPGDVVR